jgi:23S rRNA (uracil1939-C5)-methyltransferase
MPRIEIEKLVHGGSGVGTLDGMRVFVPFSAPGDVLDVEIVAEHKNFAEAAIRKIIEPSRCRVEPMCPVFGSCGGCQWQHIAYEAQLEWKRAILKESLERIGGIADPKTCATVPSPHQWHYRNKIQLHVDSKGRVGFYKPRSKEVVEFDECLIAEEGLNEMLCRTRDEIARRDRGIALKAHDVEESFLQVNSAQNENMKSLVVEYLERVPHESVLELYAGAGNFSFAVGKVATRVVASDIDRLAIEAAIVRAKKDEVSNIEFVCALSGRAARRMAGICDAVLLDPPRKGCDDAIEDILGLSPASIIYVSCDPATLARDVATLAAAGYEFIESTPVDMFPQTFHIESITLLSHIAARRRYVKSVCRGR